MNIQFKRFTQISSQKIIDLMNNPLVRRQMPLLQGHWDQNTCASFVVSKENLWNEHGYGPWAFVVDGKFAGWGGLQPEGDETDLALVLHPDFWGIGKTLYRQIIDQAFSEMGLDSVTVLFPPSRTRIQGFLRLGFREDKELEFNGETFIRYRLENPDLLN